MNEKNNLSLFNELDNTVSLQLQQQLVAVTQNIGCELSFAEVTDIYEARNMALKENHLIDFSLQNTVQLAHMLCEQEKLSAKQLTSDLKQALEIFYYLRSAENTSISDEELIERMAEVFQHYAGDFENIEGYFESHPLLSEEETIWTMD